MTTSLPRWIWAPSGIAIAFLALPLLGLLWRVPWASAASLLMTPAALSALGLSLITCLIATTLALALGVPLALLLARAKPPAATIGRTLVMIPMVLPPVVAGLALLSAFGRRGLVGAPLSVLGIEIGFTTLAVVLAQTFVAMPFLVISLEGALRSSNQELADVAASLGARPTRVLSRVTLPLATPALVSGTALTFARALGEFGATLTFAGSLEGVTRTLPLQIYLTREQDSDLGIGPSSGAVAGCRSRGRHIGTIHPDQTPPASHPANLRSSSRGLPSTHTSRFSHRIQ